MLSYQQLENLAELDEKIDLSQGPKTQKKNTGHAALVCSTKDSFIYTWTTMSRKYQNFDYQMSFLNFNNSEVVKDINELLSYSENVVF